MDLTFTNGNLSGSGSDDVGRFLMKGRYDESTSECYWTKTYIGAHDVFYRGYREGKGIWGRWEIQSRFHGGFHIWPKGAHEGDQDAVHEAESEPVDAVGVNVRADPVPRACLPARFAVCRRRRKETLFDPFLHLSPLNQGLLTSSSTMRDEAALRCS